MSRRKPYLDEPLEVSPYGEDLDRELTARPARAKLPKLTLALGAGVMLVAGVLLGIQAQKTWGTQNTDRQALIGAMLNGQGGQRGIPSAGPGGGVLRQGGFGNMTVGTVKLVDGDKIYVESANGGTTIVTTTGDTKVRLSKEGKVKDLKPGSTVIVQGDRDESGNVAATQVSEGGLPGMGVRQ